MLGRALFSLVPRMMINSVLRVSLCSGIRTMSRNIGSSSGSGSSGESVADIFNDEMAATFGSPPSMYDGNEDVGSLRMNRRDSEFSPSTRRVDVIYDEGKMSESTSSTTLKSQSTTSSISSRVGEIHVHIHLPVGHTAASPNIVVHVHVKSNELE